MRYVPWLLCAVFVPAVVLSQTENRVLFTELDHAISNKKLYENQKEDYIDSITQKLKITAPNLYFERYNILNQLHTAYFTFDYDSAMEMAIQMLAVAQKLQDPSKISEARFKISLSLLSSGVFSEARDTLETVDLNTLNDSLKTEYFYISARLYFDMADSYEKTYYSQIFIEKGLQYLDSAIAFTDSAGMLYLSLNGLKYVRLLDYDKAAQQYEHLFSQFIPFGRQFAIDASTYGFVLQNLDSSGAAIGWYIRAAIKDIELANKENVALLNLAIKLFESGDTERSSKYLAVAMEDARSFGAIQRTFQILEIQPLVEIARLNLAEKQKTRIKRYAIAVSALSLLVIIAVFLILRQLQKTRTARNELNRSNNELTKINHKLREVNLIKEEYIGFFFRTNSDLIDKFEKYRQGIANKITLNKINELAELISIKDIRQERETLYSSFDKAFLNIFPDFIEKFNKLFKPEDQVIPNNSKQMNTDLRIFALIRLGIIDTEKIAQILNYSVNTINTYKTRIKNLSLVPNEEFEKEIQRIESI